MVPGEAQQHQQQQTKNGTLHRSVKRQTFQSKATNDDNSTPTAAPCYNHLHPRPRPEEPLEKLITRLARPDRHQTVIDRPTSKRASDSSVSSSPAFASSPSSSSPSRSSGESNPIGHNFITVEMIRVIPESFNAPSFSGP